MARALTLLRRLGLPLLLSAAAAPACALGPSAPFTPPAAAASAPAIDSAQTAAAADASGLAGVRLGATPQALIDGHWHRAGDAVRGARLVAVTRHGVTLQHPDGRVDQLFLLQSAIAPARARP
jgi:hypothetical protein